MADLIEPRTLKGFRDYPPPLMIPREHLLEKARQVYRSYGFAPIDTPALEYAEILLGKGGEETDKQLYRFQHERHDVALRFDLTVPFARFAAQNIARLGTPFKRYHMGPVWRGENTQKGRYREFWQCDFDTIGTTSNAADIEVVLVIHDLMRALGLERFRIHINNRLVLNGLLEELGLTRKTNALLRALDKLPKIGREAVRKEMIAATPAQAEQILTLLQQEVPDERLAGLLGELGLAHLKDRLLAAVRRLEVLRASEEGQQNLREEIEKLREEIVGVTPGQADRVLALVEIQGTNREILDRLGKDFGTNAKAADGIARLRELLEVTGVAGVPEERLQLDVSIARGLDYYTGAVYETFLSDLPKIGSVCSGGRYDNLAGLYTKQQLPGVGASLGLDRLLAAMEELQLLPKAATPGPVLLVQFEAARLGEYQKMARSLRAEGIGVEVYPDAKKIGAQLKYALARGFRIALIPFPEEFARGEWQIKDLAREEKQTVPAAEVAVTVRKILSGT
jgi:histidyl-tRNA synthetase